MNVLNRPQVVKKMSKVYKPKQTYNTYKENHIQEKIIYVPSFMYCPIMGMIYHLKEVLIVC